ncbi:hypothetical protein KCU95_g4633, partial [Aureobasidium melanogenum]
MQKDISEKPSVMMVEDIGNDDDLQKPQVKKDYSGVAEKTDPAEIALVKKLDRWVMPMLWSMYWLNYLDRNAIALARLNDLEEDLNLTGTQYLTCVSILFVGYLLRQVVWLFALMAHLHLAANGFKNFFPTVVKTLGFDTTITLVLTCPPYLIAGASTLLVSWSSGKMNETHLAHHRFQISRNLMNASFIWTPYLWDPKDAPQYQPAMFSSAAFSAGTALVAWIVKIIMKRRNEKLRQSEDEVQTFYVY